MTVVGCQGASTAGAPRCCQCSSLLIRDGCRLVHRTRIISNRLLGDDFRIALAADDSAGPGPYRACCAIYRGYRLTEGRDRLEGKADLHPGSDRCPGGHRGDVVRPDVHPVRTRRRRDLGPAGSARRPADHARVHLRDRAGCDARGLRHVGRAGEPSELEVAADRAAGDPDPGSLIAPAGANLPSQRRPGHDQHDVSPSEPPGRPARCRHGRLPRRRRLFGAELSRGDGGAGELRRLPRQSVAERVLPGLRLVRAAA